jgi:hypothetical protein
MEKILSQQMETVFSSKQKSKKTDETPEEQLIREKITAARTPADLIRGVIVAVLAKEFGPAITRQIYFEKMVTHISTALLANSEIKNRLIKMALKYMAGGASSKES